ncbi:hypothetical protein AALB64_00595 [Lachnospiraceae bacterium 45-P1]
MRGMAKIEAIYNQMNIIPLGSHRFLGADYYRKGEPTNEVSCGRIT